VIPSYRVNDGVCDCCDGSDEYSDVSVLATCNDNCEEFGRAMREAEKKRLETAAAGYKMREQFSARGKKTRDEKAATLAVDKAARAVAQAALDTANEAKTAAEEPETKVRPMQ
jgi:protein kinase C substrate 80K-H